MKGNSKAKKTVTVEDMFAPEELKLIGSIMGQDPAITGLDCDAINIDYAYQTRPRQRIQDQIAYRLCPAFLGILLISQRPDGTHWVMDGATRVLGIRQRGEKHRTMRCQIFETEGQKAEALIFDWSNGQRSKERIKLENHFVAQGVAETDHGFAQAIYDCGYELTGRGKRHVNGASYIKTAWNLDNDGTAMKKSLFSIKDAWRDQYPTEGIFVLGMARLYHYTGRPLDEQLRRVLRHNSPAQINDLVSTRYAKAGGKQLRIHPGEKPKIIARVLADLINKSRSRGAKIDVKRLDPDGEVE